MQNVKCESDGNNTSSLYAVVMRKKNQSTSSKNSDPVKYHKHDLVNYYIDETFYSSEAVKSHRQQQK